MADPRKLKDEAAAAVAKGRYKRAAELYAQIARFEKDDAQWPHRAGEALKRLGDKAAAIEQLTVAAEGYARTGFFLKAISVVKQILEIDPGRTETQAMLAALYARRDTHEPGAARHSRPPVTIEARPDEATAPSSLPPPVASPIEVPDIAPAMADFEPSVDQLDLVRLDQAVAATRAAPPPLPQPQPLGLLDLNLSDRIPGSRNSQQFSIAAMLIPLDETTGPLSRTAPPRDLPEIPLFSSFDERRLHRLIQSARIVRCAAGQAIVRQGESGSALYVVVRGGVAVRVDGVPEPVARLNEGDFFGELALLSSEPRLATVQAEVDTEVLEIERDVMWELIEESPDVLRILLRFFRDRLVERLMTTSPLFTPLAPQQSHDLAQRFEFLELRAGSTLVREGERAEGLFVILLGRGDVVASDAGHLADVGPGDLVGEMSLLTRRPAIATVTARSPLWALALPRALFQEVILTHPQVLIYVNEVADARRSADTPRLQLV